MPLYEYGCRSCRRSFDLVRPIAERDNPASCPRCGMSNIQRKYTSAPHSFSFAMREVAERRSGLSSRKWQAVTVIFVILAGCGLAVVKLKLWGFWENWLDGKVTPSAKLSRWPIMYWGRLGKILEFIGGLTVILDLAGEERVDRWHAAASSRFTRTAALSRTMIARTLAPWKSQVGSLAWLTLPILCIANGTAIYYFEASIVHSGKTFALWAAVLTGLIVVVFLVIWSATDSFFTAYVTYNILLFIILITSFVRYSFHYEHAAWWVRYLLSQDSPGPFLVAAAISAIIYLLIMSLLLLIELSGRLVGAAVVVGSTTMLRWALHKKARPLRWMALILFLIGFHFDLLAA
jgi:putative FmdB family regulatory protein